MTLLYPLALVGAVTAAVGIYRVRWIFDSNSWKRGSPWGGLPWGLG